MNSTETAGDELARPLATLLLRVRYLASPRLYIEPRVDNAETLAALKPRVLQHFGLAEGDVNGGRKEYVFADDGVIQTNVNVTVGELSNGKHTLLLTLLEQFVQG
jgi:hypothetical protein